MSSRIEEDGARAFLEGKSQRDCPKYRGSRIEQLRKMKSWLRGFRSAKRQQEHSHE